MIALAVLVPVLVALLVLVNVVGRSGGSSGGGSGGVADVSGPTSSSRDELPIVTVQTAAPSGDADVACPVFVDSLPGQLVGETPRRVKSTSPYVRAWGNPAIVLVCGVDRPATFTVGVGLIQIDDVQWFVDTSDPKTVVWTAVDRPVYVQVRVPASTDSASVTELTSHITATLPARQPQPGP